MTTPIDPVERRLPEALTDLAAPRTPDYFIDILGQTARIRQRPAWVRPGRWIVMNGFLGRPALAAVVVVLIAVIGVGFFVSRSDDSAVIGGPSPSPIASASPAPTTTPAASSAGAIPDTLVSMWVSAPRTIQNLVPSARFRFQLTADQLDFPFDNLVNAQLVSSASAPTPGRLQLVTSDSTDGCKPGDTGTYDWSLSAGGTILTITSQTDACATRGLAMPGQWFRVGCTNVASACLGNLETGTHASQYITPRLPDGATWAPQWGALTYTTPAGWANSVDWPDSFSLTPSIDYVKETKDGAAPGTWHEVDVFARPAAVDPACVKTVLTGVPRTVDGLIAHITSSKSLTASAVHSITIGGRPAKWVDIAIASTWTAGCVAEGTPFINLLAQADDPTNGWSFGLEGAERARMIFVDLGAGQTSLILVDSGDPTRFDQLASDAMPIIESFSFK